jgi:hypothetical protein
MKSEIARIENVEAYIADYPAPVQKLLRQMRAAIRKAAPKADEIISYKIPWPSSLFCGTHESCRVVSDGFRN